MALEGVGVRGQGGGGAVRGREGGGRGRVARRGTMIRKKEMGTNEGGCE